MINFVNTGADEAILKSMSADGCSEDLIKAMNKQGLVQKDVTVQGKNGKTFTRKQWVKAGDASTGDSSKKQTSIPSAVRECGVTGNETVQELEKIRRDLYKEMTYCFKKYDKALASNDSADANVWGTMAGGKQNRLGALDRYIKGIKSAQASSASQDDKKKAPTQPTSQATTQTAQVAQNPQGKGAKLSKEDAKKKTQSYTSKVGKTDAERKAFMDKAKSQGISWKEDAHTGINWMRCCMAMNKYFAEGGSFDDSIKDTSTSVTKSSVPKTLLDAGIDYGYAPSDAERTSLLIGAAGYQDTQKKVAAYIKQAALDFNDPNIKPNVSFIMENVIEVGLGWSKDFNPKNRYDLSRSDGAAFKKQIESHISDMKFTVLKSGKKLSDGQTTFWFRIGN